MVRTCVVPALRRGNEDEREKATDKAVKLRPELSSFRLRDRSFIPCGHQADLGRTGYRGKAASIQCLRSD